MKPGGRAQRRSSQKWRWQRYADSPDWLSSSMHIRTRSGNGSDNFRSAQLIYPVLRISWRANHQLIWRYRT
jgi:hypothetical protein